ncbi:hypothetical protein [Paenibacillus aestuarii]|uniref:Uncharacterized protein n=1 Tax=Paenibacillus aestuarii TaxID=516965 RepID=A0ABW0K4Z5_9BACL|nr:hypothetical protein [Paenibacillus aestuarii]
MFGTIRINFIVAALAAVLTFALSISNNLLLTTCLRSLYSFIILFVLSFVFRWVVGFMIHLDNANPKHVNEEPAQPAVGQTLDLTTPDEDAETRELLKANMNAVPSSPANDTQFSPLNPPKLVSKNNLDPEQLAGALRRLSED